MNVVASVNADVDLSRTMFLVVDDKPYFRDIAHNALNRGRAKDVKYATSVDQARDVLKRFGQHIGVIVCDWDMTPVGGLELLRMIRAGKLPRTPRDTCVVIFTSEPNAAAVKAAMQLDVNGFAVAPLSLEKLIKTIGHAMQRPVKLRAPEQYLAVPAVELPKAMSERMGKDVVNPIVSALEADAAKAGRKPGPAQKPSELANVRMCTLAEARPGAVLARDLKDKEGQLLLAAGAELTSVLLEKLNAVADGHSESYHVWVGERRA